MELILYLLGIATVLGLFLALLDVVFTGIGMALGAVIFAPVRLFNKLVHRGTPTLFNGLPDEEPTLSSPVQCVCGADCIVWSNDGQTWNADCSTCRLGWAGAHSSYDAIRGWNMMIAEKTEEITQIRQAAREITNPTAV